MTDDQHKRYVVRRTSAGWEVTDTRTGLAVITFGLYLRELAELDADVRNRHEAERAALDAVRGVFQMFGANLTPVSMLENSLDERERKERKP